MLAQVTAIMDKLPTVCVKKRSGLKTEYEKNFGWQ
ncbi:hypothetical protein EPIR_1464 [Erwinia piriflorinigrans CFBP 5888]|uniref:Uncharacterized protein n=1 Tax=Erwinia piriflorinigrans CFBP 5888 TaxID=1161919 RepID=V5Z782_9GAMM|nr:hypothetical protein EPIR_1464 [Erwinia piriflorinigrans CFBP 5888]